MLKNKKAIAIISVLLIIFLLYNIFFTNNNILALSKYGSRGSEVTQIQTKLKRWGYYSGSIDGIYGSETIAAVKYFQRKNGITPARYRKKYQNGRKWESRIENVVNSLKKVYI